jgi:hypothetical protein
MYVFVTYTAPLALRFAWIPILAETLDQASLDAELGAGSKDDAVEAAAADAVER